jgi:5-formyltetrahydrofolate cyclo-ligase
MLDPKVPVAQTGSDIVEAPEISRAKADLRSALLKRRKNLRDKEPRAPEKIRDKVTDHLKGENGITVAGYVAIGDELDPSPALKALWDRGIALVLPVAGDAGETMTFQDWTFGERLVRGPYSTYVPGGELIPIDPNVIIVPVVAFDAEGYRLGFGGGFYDRTIAALRKDRKIVTYGVAYDGQEVPKVPRGPFDVRLDGLFTPTRFLEFT